MKSVLTPIVLGVLALAAFISTPLHAQTVLTAPQVAGCPAGKDGTCKYLFYPLTDTTHWMATGSKSAPSYAHTLAGYAPTPSALLVACPKGATLSIDQKTCTSAGADASQLVAYSQLAAFSITPAVSTHAYLINWSASVDGYLVQHSVDGGRTWDAGQSVPASSTSVTYAALPSNIPQCFQVITVSKTVGNSDPTVTCVPAGTPVAPAGVTATAH